jgi:hypothetical protein
MCFYSFIYSVFQRSMKVDTELVITVCTVSEGIHILEKEGAV